MTNQLQQPKLFFIDCRKSGDDGWECYSVTFRGSTISRLCFDEALYVAALIIVGSGEIGSRDEDRINDTVLWRWQIEEVIPPSEWNITDQNGHFSGRLHSGECLGIIASKLLNGVALLGGLKPYQEHFAYVHRGETRGLLTFVG